MQFQVGHSVFWYAGVILPKLGIFALIDLLTERRCQGKGAFSDANASLAHLPCPRTRNAAGRGNACTDEGGECAIVSDGFYPLSYGMITVGLLLWLYFRRTLPKLDLLQTDSWRAKSRRV